MAQKAVSRIKVGDCVEYLVEWNGWGAVKAVQDDIVTVEFWLGYNHKVVDLEANFQVVPRDRIKKSLLFNGGKDA